MDDNMSEIYSHQAKTCSNSSQKREKFIKMETKVRLHCQYVLSLYSFNNPNNNYQFKKKKKTLEQHYSNIFIVDFIHLIS